LKLVEPERYAAEVAAARVRQSEKRRNGYGPTLRAQDRARYWRERGAVVGATVEEIAERTGFDVETIAAVLRDETRRRRGRRVVELDGRYYALPGRFPPEVAAALLDL
jgi:hypothetical protein